MILLLGSITIGGIILIANKSESNKIANKCNAIKVNPKSTQEEKENCLKLLQHKL